VLDYEYSLEKGRRVLIGLTAKETTEFESLDAQIPLDGKPIWPDTANSSVEERWLVLYNKHEAARQGARLRFA
jgi:hypothetical protein